MVFVIIDDEASKARETLGMEEPVFGGEVTLVTESARVVCV
jgi:hypothetical protein